MVTAFRTASPRVLRRRLHSALIVSRPRTATLRALFAVPVTAALILSPPTACPNVSFRWHRAHTTCRRGGPCHLALKGQWNAAQNR